jgi:hypothetical protein
MRHSSARYSSSYLPAVHAITWHVNKRLLHLACLFMLLLALASLGRAQDSPGRFEAGAAFTVIKSDGAGGGPFGPGIEGDINFGRHFALDGTLNWLPERFGLISGGRVVQGLIGAKVGTRFQHFGLFAKVRPGVVTAGSAVRSIVEDFSPNTLSSPPIRGRLTETALDLGGVVEYYPARHWALRYDFGNTMIFENPIRVTVIGNLPPGFTFSSLPGATTNHFQFSASVHYRF